MQAQLDALKQSLEGKIDFVGQDLVEERAKWILWAAAAISFVVGLAVQSIKVTLGLFAVGFVACLAITLPPLPAYTAHPVKWLPTLDQYGEAVPSDTAPVGAKKDR
ncbi:hypothetical protein BMF94_3089 [Rhodotorula taiwanensis]|uniref:Signal peptidase complex subunit 1 n=1 Tax=Rhodotorula taiwanensis TaxID=741276 RepID=A0A2S5BAY2_9BASI|nr:hypothetical protein BMF94_3089 [Rhodotorula taiwanensis]